MACCLTTLGSHAQDDDVYFVPSSKDKIENVVPKNYESSSYSDWNDNDDEYSDWADGRSNGNWDDDSYNRRGQRHEKEHSDRYDKKTKHQKYKGDDYEEGYEDGYADGYFTSRLIRFCSPRIGVYVSSPYYWDYYAISYLDPWYYGWGPSWSWGWGGFYWNSWYAWNGWYGYYPHWHYGSWYDPWFGGCYPHYVSHYYPSNAQRGPVGGYIAYGSARGVNGRNNHYGSSTNRRPANRYSSLSNYGSNRGTGNGTYRPSRSFGNRQYNSTGNGSYNNRPSRSFGNRNNSNNTQFSQPSNRGNYSRPSRSFNNRSNNESHFNRSNSPMRSNSSFGSGHSNRGGFGGGFSGGRSGGGRSFGGRR